MKDWDKYLPQVIGAYNSTIHATTGVPPFMLLTGKGRNMPLVYFHPENKDQYAIPRDNATKLKERLRAINELVKANTVQAQISQKRNHDERLKGTKPFEIGDYMWVFIKGIEWRHRQVASGMRTTFQLTKRHQEGRGYVLFTGHKD